MKLLETVRPELIKVLPTQNRDMQASAELQTMGIGKLVTLFLNWRDRQVYSRPRKVLKSAEILASIEYEREELRCRRLFAKIASGQDLTLHLSRRTRIAYLSQAERKKNKQRPDLDLLLNEWGIHHLHLSEADPATGFAKDDNILLFIVFKNDAAHALSLMPHGEWMNEDLVSVAVHNWPEKGLFHKLVGALPEQALLPKERSTLRRRHINYFCSVDGQSYMSDTGGLSSNGTSSRSVIQMMALQRCCNLYDEQPDLLSKQMKEEANKIGVFWPSRPVFRCILINGVERLGFGIIEEKSGVAVGISGL